MNDRQDVIHEIVLWLLGLTAAALLAWAAWEGRDFYLTTLADRPHHEDFREFRSAGRIGHGLGILGSSMVVLLLFYSLRKRWRPLARAGQLRYWLRYHILLGVAGPAFITLHTSFKVNGLVAVSYWSMMAVALSGVFGRYLYQQIPRNVLDEAVPLDVVEQRNEAIMVEMTDRFGIDQKAQDGLDRLATGPLEGRSAPLALCMLPVVNLFLARRLQQWVREYEVPENPDVLRLAKQWVLAARRMQLFHLIRDLFHWWHVFHKPFAVIMILVMIVHVAVAVALGYTWILGTSG